MTDFYRKQMMAFGIGEQGQARLASASVLIVGAGGLGHPAALYLAGAGIGHLGVVDFDLVEESNLHRQVVFNACDIGRLKVDVLHEKLLRQNPHIRVSTFAFALNASTDFLLQEFDLIIDGSDNFTTKFFLHDSCRALKKPLLQASISAWSGQLNLFTFSDPDAPCLRCLYPTEPSESCTQNCAEAGVVGSTAGVFGSLLANEVIKLLTGKATLPQGTSLHLDLLDYSLHRFNFHVRPACVCRSHAEAATQQNEFELSTTDLREEDLLIDVREALDFTPSPDNRTILFCQRGVKSLRLTRELRAQGATHIWSLKGGLASLPSPVLAKLKDQRVGEPRPANEVLHRL